MGARIDVGVDEALFEPFSWLSERANRHIDCTEATQDIAGGVALILELIESSDLAKDSGGRPILSTTKCGMLMRLAVTSLGLLSGHAEEIITWKNDKARAAGEAASKGKKQ